MGFTWIGRKCWLVARLLSIIYEKDIVTGEVRASQNKVNVMHISLK